MNDIDFKTDFLVIGSGVAGLTFALKAASYGHVTIVTKKGLFESNTSKAQGGIASVSSKLDSFDLHIADTLAAGDGLCNSDVASMVVKNGPNRIRELISLGVNFNIVKSEQKRNSTHPDFHLGQEGGHSQKRILHAEDMTGMELQRVLSQAVINASNIDIYENHMAVDLITFSTHFRRGLVTTIQEDYCCGAYILDEKTNKVKTFSSKITLLATGGAGKVYLYTSNPDIATGDGIAMGYRAGVTVANLEFVQFHPTCLFHPDAKNFLISEAVRGEGAILIDSEGHAFMDQYDDQKDLACRDVVARAIDTELKKSGADSVFLDITHHNSNFIKQRFPNLFEKCLTYGIDMTKDPIPIVPAAHYMCGGVATDMNGKTSTQRLYAVGEVACTGLHGANRLASNSLLEALVYAENAFQKAKNEIQSIDFSTTPSLPSWDEVGTTDSDEVIMVSHNWDEIRRLMWNYVGIVRSDKRLERAQRRIEIIQNEIQEYYWDFRVTPDLIELRNIATVAELIIKCSRHRKESRGLHYNIAYPNKDDQKWLKDTILRRPLMK